MSDATETKKTQRLDKLLCVLGGAGDKGLTTKQLSDQLGIGEKSVPVYVTHARKVLPETASILKTARGSGATQHRYYRLVQQ